MSRGLQRYGGFDGVNAKRLKVSWSYLAETLFQANKSHTSRAHLLKTLYNKHLRMLEALPPAVLPRPPLATSEVRRAAAAAPAGAVGGARRDRRRRRYESDASSDEEGEWVPPYAESDGELFAAESEEDKPEAEAHAGERLAQEAIFELRDAIFSGNIEAVRRLLTDTTGLINYVWTEARVKQHASFVRASACPDALYVCAAPPLWGLIRRRTPSRRS
jgi:hypothetical protein